MIVFVINCGSSSLKYQMFNMPDEKPVCSGLVERIGLNDGMITHKIMGENPKLIKIAMPIANHELGLRKVVELLTDKKQGILTSVSEVKMVGHRAVHGGSAFNKTTVITPQVKEKIKELFALAPLHNPANYTGMEVAEKIFTSAIQVAVFDTAFHHTMPEKAYRYAINNELYCREHIRAFGFHGISHKYVSTRAMAFLNNPKAKLITIHLGNGSSMTAVDAGISVDHSMGFGPMGGLIMGTRCGDFDPSAIFHLLKNGYAHDELDMILNKKSGMLGLTGYSDMRDITQRIREGDREAAIAYEMYAYRIQKYIGSFTAVLNGLDAIVFTAGIGENDALVRQMVCTGMDYLGIEIDEEKNSEKISEVKAIEKPESKVKVLVIPTNEELEIAKECYELYNSSGTGANSGY